MFAIHKYYLRPKTYLSIAKTAKILKIHSQRHEICIWVLDDPDTDDRMIVYLETVPTGHVFSDCPGTHLGTSFVDDYVVHTFWRNPDISTMPTDQQIKELQLEYRQPTAL